MADVFPPHSMNEALPERSFGWWDMFVHPDVDPRADGGFENTERAMLLGFLNDRRLTLKMKCEGLGAEELARRSVPPSDLSLLGVIRHLAGVEVHWFQAVIAGRDIERPYEDEFSVEPDAAMVADAWATWRDAVMATDSILASVPDLGDLGVGKPTPVREVLIHLIREYAQHMGHADLLRERIDGRVGQ